MIPRDDKVIVSQNKGVPVISMHTKSSRAFMNVARIVNSPRIMPVDLNNDNSCEKQERICFNGKECGYEA